MASKEVLDSRKVAYTHPLTKEQMIKFNHRLVDLGLSFSEWVRINISDEIGEGN